MILTYKYRLKDKRRTRRLLNFAFAVNQVWNYCVEVQRKAQRLRREGAATRWPSQFDLQALTKGVSKDIGIHAQTVQRVCEQFIRSRDLNKRCPRFRSSKKALGWIPFQAQSRQIAGNQITYLGVNFRFFGEKRRPLPEKTKGGCFVEDSRGRWYVCFHVEVSPLPRVSSSKIGIDLGLSTLATLSNGEKIEAPRYYRLYEEKLIIATRANKKDRVRALNARIKDSRRDYLHKVSTNLVHTYNQIFVGNVSSSQLVQTKMAKSVYDASWATLRTFLRYKASRHGGNYQEVDEKWSTQICSACGILPASRPRGITDLGIREWRCSSCGTLHDRDVNAAKNILAFGRSVTPLVEESRVAYGR